jgi:hypothetical protein
MDVFQSILIGDSPLTLLAEPIRFPDKNRSQMELPPDYVYWVLVGRKELFAGSEEDAAKMTSTAFTGAEAARLSLDLTEEWHPSLNSLMRLQDTAQCSTLQVVSAMPNIAQWEPSRFVTLVSSNPAISSRCVCTDSSILALAWRFNTSHVAMRRRWSQHRSNRCCRTSEGSRRIRQHSRSNCRHSFLREFNEGEGIQECDEKLCGIQEDV